MKKIRFSLQIICSEIFLFFRIILGNRIKANPINFVSPFAHIRTEGKKSSISIGYGSAVRANTEIHASNGTISIADKCFINRNCLIVAHGNIKLMRHVSIGPNTCIYDHDHDANGDFYSKDIEIGENVWIGAGCIILKGVKIGNNSIIGAGSIIAKDVPSESVVIQKRINTVWKRKE
ncbi:acyltransferase [Caproicibacterium sp. NSD3]